MVAYLSLIGLVLSVAYPGTPAAAEGREVLSPSPQISTVEGLAGHRELMTRGADAAALPEAPSEQAGTSHVRAPSGTLDANFVGLSGSIKPSDGALAVGPSSVVEIVNGTPGTSNVGIYDKSGRVLRLTTLTELLGLSGTTLISDPRAYYDPISSRWYVVVFGIDLSELVARFYLGISRSADPLGGFCEFSKDESVK